MTYDGQIVDNGSIAFIAMDDSGTADANESVKIATLIKDGKYSFNPERSLPSGKYRVEIRWNWNTGRMTRGRGKDDTGPELEQILPPKYNTESTLIRDIKSSESNLDFNLEK